MWNFRNLSLAVTFAVVFWAPPYVGAVAGEAGTSIRRGDAPSRPIVVGAVTVISFAPGEFRVAHGDMEKLRALVLSNKADHGVEKLIVAAWSDMEFPDAHTQLSEGQHRLAASRANAIVNVLIELKAGGVDTYNMARRPGWLARLARSEETRVKTFLDGASADAVTTAVGATLKDQGGPGKAVVIVKRVSTAVAH